MFAAVRREPIGQPAELQQGVLGGGAGEGTHGRPDRPRLGPSARACPRLQAREIPLVQIDL
ncbi:MAG: hypothetical protein AUH20_04220 [Candidatus Rokubacteria bacterium 13_2_20CM_69_15_2]|nr:MAG: hypothetical protein AUH20_04220 [Candidatus Rokubacteria bacterium 13_2_20CM_69_15_2]